MLESILRPVERVRIGLNTIVLELRVYVKQMDFSIQYDNFSTIVINAIQIYVVHSHFGGF